MQYTKIVPNGHNNLYVVTHGNRKHEIDRVWHNEKQFQKLPQARLYAQKYNDTAIFKLHFDSDTGDLCYIEGI